MMGVFKKKDSREGRHAMEKGRAGYSSNPSCQIPVDDGDEVTEQQQ